ncbi:hypothetical protein Hypma_006046 [Hypsizygus marmoreus]|uniref:Uncharacterized protein n=1 Tax=Hypsizygus marmoreus TaxID=39966 RepID=A0A369K110_HYPMA|nr:hypothetical protein Hypma_006046 [Hypsizygus marmoreus]
MSAPATYIFDNTRFMRSDSDVRRSGLWGLLPAGRRLLKDRTAIDFTYIPGHPVSVRLVGMHTVFCFLKTACMIRLIRALCTPQEVSKLRSHPNAVTAHRVSPVFIVFDVFSDETEERAPIVAGHAPVP